MRIPLSKPQSTITWWLFSKHVSPPCFSEYAIRKDPLETEQTILTICNGPKQCHKQAAKLFEAKNEKNELQDIEFYGRFLRAPTMQGGHSGHFTAPQQSADATTIAAVIR